MKDTSSLHYIIAPREPHETGPRPLLVLLHGRGSDENDLISLTPYFDPRFLVVSVRAPRRFVAGGYTWYDLFDIGRPNMEHLVESHGFLLHLLDELRRTLPVDASRICLFGFSMGAMMSLTLALTHPEQIRGVVAHSGYLPEDTPLEYRWDSLGHTSFFIAHGTQDPVVPVAMARRTAELLKPTGAPLTYREYSIPHTISDESLDEISQWLRRMLDRAG